MRKQELIHLHALFSVVRRHLEEGRDPPERPFETYDALGVSSVDVPRRKEAHQEAVFRLLDGIDTVIDATDDPTTATAVPVEPES